MPLITFDDVERAYRRRYITRQELQDFGTSLHRTPFRVESDSPGVFESEVEYLQFCEMANAYAAGTLNEWALPTFLKDKLDFIKSLAATVRQDVGKLLAAFKNTLVYKFFSAIGWSLTKLFELAKQGLAYYRKVLDAVAEFVAKTKVGKWTEESLRALQEFLNKHPLIKRMGGPAVAALLVWVWLNMTFTGDFHYDFDLSTVLQALAGKYSLPALFAGKDGLKMLMLLATGMIGLSFPWPGPTSAKFATAVVNGAVKIARGG